jgi:hypothetical protein
MTAVQEIGKGLFSSGEFNSTLLSGDIQAYFAAPAVSQQVIVEVTNDMQIIGWTMLGSVSGSCVIDIWRTSIVAGATPLVPVVGNSITGTYLPTLTSAVSAKGGSPPGYAANAQSMQELGWGGAGVAAKAGNFLNAGDFLIFNVNSYTAGGIVLCYLHCLQGS